MPPKKKGKKGKKAKAKEVPQDEDKFKRTQKEVVLVKDKLALQTEISRRATSVANIARGDAEEISRKLTKQKKHEKEISAELSRQYKTMQTEMSISVRQLEAEVSYLRQQLSHANNELETCKKSATKMEEEKNMRISELQMRIDGMEGSYERVLTEALDSLMLKIENSSRNWDKTSVAFQEKSKVMLQQFGLNPLDI